MTNPNPPAPPAEKPAPKKEDTHPSTAPMPGLLELRKVGDIPNIIQQGEQQRTPLGAPPEDASAASPPETQEEYHPLTPEQRRQRKALLITALERGVVHDRLHVPLPRHLHGEWVRRDPLEIQRMQTLGFQDGSEWVARRALHSDGATHGVADVVFMVTTRENKELIDEVRHEQFLAINAKPGDVHGKQKEEQDFEAASNKETGGEIQAVHRGTVRAARKHDIEDALREANRLIQGQITPVTNRG